MNFYDFFNLLFEYNELLLPDVFKYLKNDPNIFVHFSNSNFAKPNPLPIHHDPIGVYAFPSDYILDGHLKSNTWFASFPYIFLLKPNNKAKILNLDMDEQTKNTILSQMGITSQWIKENQDKIQHKNGNTPGHMFWATLEFYRHSINKPQNSSWNVLFNKTGFNILYDPGLGIIHSNEPNQIVFLNSSCFDVVDFIFNKPEKFIKDIKNKFPDFRLKKHKKKYESTVRFYFENKKREYFEFAFWERNINLSVNGKFVSMDNLHTVDALASLIHEKLKETPIDHHIPDSRKEEGEINFKKIIDTFNITKHLTGDTTWVRDYIPKNNKDVNLRVVLQYDIFNGTIHLSLDKRNRMYYLFDNYYFYGETKLLDDPVKTMKNLFGVLEKNIKNDTSIKDLYDERKIKNALNDLEFIKKRVFGIK